MYSPQFAYFDDEDILEKMQLLDQLADEYYEAGYDEETCEAAAMFDFEAMHKMSPYHKFSDTIQ